MTVVAFTDPVGPDTSIELEVLASLRPRFVICSADIKSRGLDVNALPPFEDVAALAASRFGRSVNDRQPL